MSYIAEYWTEKEKRAKKASNWVAKMENYYPTHIQIAANKTKTFDQDYVFTQRDDVRDMEIKIIEKDSVSAIRSEARMIEREGTNQKLAVLNFSSYKHPGGMFLQGSKAQEECLCHESFLYNVLKTQDKFYEWNVKHKHNVIIHQIETNKDHIHYMIETEPNVNLSDLVRTIKSYTTYHIWKLHKEYLSKHFWRENTFWTDGYFICSIGNVSEKQLRKYIENQG